MSISTRNRRRAWGHQREAFVIVEQQLNHRVLYSVKVNTDADDMEFPIGIQDQGSATANETVVLTSALALAEELEAAARLRLGAATRR